MTTTTSTADYPIQEVPFTLVRFRDTFWRRRIETNRTVTIPIAFRHCEETGRIDNFDVAAGTREGAWRGEFPFDDTDIYKIIEGASFSLAVHPDPELDAYVDRLVEKIAAAQEEDGYLYTCRTAGAEHLRQGWMGQNRWDMLTRSHELYNAGHLFEAAYAHYSATGKTGLVDVSRKFADCIDRAFGWSKLERSPGHQVIEMGLAKLYRITGERRYLELAKFFLDVRGHEKGGGEYNAYNQSHVPVLEQDEAKGHAVRAAYMYAGMADVASLMPEASYADAIGRLWHNVVDHKTYITGGIGSSSTNEGFLGNDVLPNMSAYCETCASIANVYWNQRLFLLEGDGKYIDVLERTLYNALLSGVSLEGDKFFYPNPLASFGQHQRSPWFGCACCPSNVCRFMASIPAYAYARRNEEVFVNLYVAGEADVDTPAGQVTLRQETNYPWSGDIKVSVDAASNAEFTLCLRVPGWARGECLPGDQYAFADDVESGVTAKLNGESVPVQIDQGYLRIDRVWSAGDTIELQLPMDVRRITCNDRVEENIGRVALQRGPLVYCGEWPDNGKHVLNVLLEDDVAIEPVEDSQTLGRIVKLRGKAKAVGRDEEGELVVIDEVKEFTAIPYYAWAHRGVGEMLVWLARDLASATSLPEPTIAFRSKKSASGGTLKNLFALSDQLEPQASDEKWQPFFHFWPANGTTEWVQYDFEEPASISRSSVYWFADVPDGGCDFPQAWRVLYRDGDEWKPVPNPSEYPVQRHRFCEVVFDEVTTDAVRLEITLKPEASAGMHEWTVD